MSISALRDELSKQMVAFAWGQWAQLGVLADAGRDDGWAADPEAMLLFTLEVARDDPRLFDELLDWLLTNERLVSVQRLRNLAQGPEDRALIDASLAWAASQRSPRRTDKRGERQGRAPRPTPLFRTSHAEPETADATFLEHGLLRATAKPSGKSQAPGLLRPIAFAFRLRALLGMGARAEVVRVLLCTDAPALSAYELAQSAAYAKRNVQEALSSLQAAGTVQTTLTGNERRYSTDRQRWAQLLDLSPDAIPAHREWTALLGALRRLSRWLADPANQELSDYMRASRARDLMEEIAPDLSRAGIHPSERVAPGAEYWTIFEDDARAATQRLAR